MTAKVEIYTWRSCPFCTRAKRLLEAKGVDYIEHAIDGDREARARMSERSQGRTSLPQIFINDHPVGGCMELQALDRQGYLDDVLAAPPAND